MPTVYNGIGTWYWGKRNVTTRRGVCTECGRVADLSSHDTTLFFVVFFVPLIPLGAKRIMNSCSVCGKHRAMKLSEFERLKTEAIGDTALEFQNRPSDPEAATKAVAATVAFDAKKEFLGLTALFTPQLARDPGFLAAMGDAYQHFGMPAESRGAYEASLKLKSEPAVSGALAINYLRDGRANDAMPLVEAVLAQQQREDAGLLYLMVEGLQAEGRHAEALDLLDRHGPTLNVTEEKEFKDYHKSATKLRESTKKVTAKSLRVGTVREAEGGWRYAAARFVPVMVVLLLAALYFGLAITRGAARQVFLVSGLPDACDVSINGKVFTLNPLIERPITISEGDVQVSVVKPAGLIPDQTLSVRTNFWMRPFVRSTFVINADELAPIMYEEAFYAKSASQAPQGVTQIKIGQALHRFDGIDYPFQPLPRSVRVKSNSTVKKTRISVLPAPAFALMQILRQELGDARIKELCVLGTQRAPETEDYFAALRLIATPAECVEAMRPLLSRRPLLVQAHRVYQDTIEVADPKHDREAEYRELCVKEPGSAAALYLYGRVLADPVAAREKYREAIAANAAMALPRGALVYSLLGEGLFAEGEKACREALAAGVQDARLTNLLAESLIGQSKYDQVLSDAALQPTPDSSVDRELRMVLLALAGRDAEASAIIAESVEGLETEDAAPVRAGLQAEIACAKKDATKAADLFKKSDHPDAALRRHVLLGEVAEAERVLAEGEANFRQDEHTMWVCMAAIRAGNSEAVARLVPEVVQNLRKGPRAEPAAADLLEQAAPPSVKDVLALRGSGDQKAMFLVLLAHKHPEKRLEFAALAEKFLGDPRFPTLVVQEAIDALKKK